MEMSREELENMGKDELLAYANDSQGLNVPVRSSKADVIAAILGEDDGAEAKPDEPLSDAEQAAASKDAKRVKIKIHEGGGADGDAPVKVGVNGRMYVIRRDAEVAVPREVLNVLRLAKQTVMMQNGTNPDGTIRYTERNVPRYSFEVLG